MFIYAQNLTNHTDLPFIPSNRFNSSILFNYELKQLHPTASIEFFAENKQKHYTEGSDYLPPPPAYQLINLSVGTTKLFGNKNIAVLVGIQNLLNKSYRSYTNRFRYYIDELGRNYTLRIQYKF
jgi:iron complex outermembrane receptor protein